MQTKKLLAILTLLFSLNLNSQIYYGVVSLYESLSLWETCEDGVKLRDHPIQEKKISEEEYCLVISTSIQINDNRKPKVEYCQVGNTILPAYSIIPDTSATQVFPIENFIDSNKSFLKPGSIITVVNGNNDTLKLTLDDSFRYLQAFYIVFHQDKKKREEALEKERNRKKGKCEELCNKYCAIQ